MNCLHMYAGTDILKILKLKLMYVIRCTHVCVLYE